MRAIIPCGRRAWSDLRNRIACGHNDAYPARTAKPYQPCTLHSLSIRVVRMRGRASRTGDLVLGVLFAVLAFAVGSAGLGNVDLGWKSASVINALKLPVSFASDECGTSERKRRWRRIGNARMRWWKSWKDNAAMNYTSAILRLCGCFVVRRKIYERMMVCWWSRRPSTPRPSRLPYTSNKRHYPAQPS
jgi:hypothetical protein